MIYKNGAVDLFNFYPNRTSAYKKFACRAGTPRKVSLAAVMPGSSTIVYYENGLSEYSRIGTLWRFHPKVVVFSVEESRTICVDYPMYTVTSIMCSSSNHIIYGQAVGHDLHKAHIHKWDERTENLNLEQSVESR